MAKNYLNDKQMKLLGKLANVELDKRLAYLDGIKDYITISDCFAEPEMIDFIAKLYNYINENGPHNRTILIDFCSYWKNGDNLELVNSFSE